MEVLREIGAQDKPSLFVFNKADCLPHEDTGFDKLRMLQGREGVFISAKSQQGLTELKDKINEFFSESRLELKLCIPYAEGAVVTRLHEVADIHSTDYDEKGTILELSLRGRQLYEVFYLIWRKLWFFQMSLLT